MNSSIGRPRETNDSAESDPGPACAARAGAANRSPYPLESKLENSTHEIIISHRITARKLARHMLKRWNARLDQEEIDSVADLALCEAARGFDPKEGSAFSTYLFYFLKGSLIKAMQMNKGVIINVSTCDGDMRKRTYGDGVQDQYIVDDTKGSLDDPDSPNSSPERGFYLLEIRRKCNEALLALSNLEREVVVKVHIFDYKVATVARRLGYSRGHISNMRKVALKKLQNQLTEFDKAA